MGEKLAILGGKPVRRQPFAEWPVFGKTEETRLLRVLHSGAWGRLQGKEVEGFEQRFAELAQKELGLTKKALTRISQNTESILAKVGEVQST